MLNRDNSFNGEILYLTDFVIFNYRMLLLVRRASAHAHTHTHAHTNTHTRFP